MNDMLFQGSLHYLEMTDPLKAKQEGYFREEQTRTDGAMK